ncbi:MAG TPA: HAD family phosphatase [bacterium]|nr:HAD family phosphatase [bacterium]
MIKHFIFDLDGTLVDSEPLFSKVWHQLGARYNRMYTPEIKASIMANKAIVAVERILEAWGLDLSPQTILSDIDSMYSELIAKDITLLPGVSTLFSRLDRLQIPKSLSTSSQRKWVDTIFNKLKLHGSFQHVITADDVREGKPHPEAFRKVIDLTGHEPEECVAVEDTPFGITSAKGAGAITIAIPGAFMPDADYSQADFILTSLQDITDEFIERLHEKKPKKTE